MHCRVTRQKGLFSMYYLHLEGKQGAKVRETQCQEILWSLSASVCVFFVMAPRV